MPLRMGRPTDLRRQTMKYVVDLERRLEKIANTLSDALGDTDPWLEPDMTDEEIRQEEPIFWACSELYEIIQTIKTEKSV